MSNNDNLLNRQTWKRILCVAPHIPSHPALCGITGSLLAVRVLFVNVLPCISGLFASFAHLLVQVITTAPPMSPLLVAVHKPSMWTESFVQQNIRWTKTSCWSQRTQRQRASQAKPSETTSDLCSLARQARRTTEHDSGSLRTPFLGLRYPRPGFGPALQQCLALDLVWSLNQPALGTKMGTRVLSRRRGIFLSGAFPVGGQPCVSKPHSAIAPASVRGLRLARAATHEAAPEKIMRYFHLGGVLKYGR